MLERQRRLNFLPEIQFQATTTCDNSIAGSNKNMGFWGGNDLKTTKKVTKATEIND